MAAQIYSTGPVHIYVAHKSTGPAAATYLGTCEKTPNVEIEYKWAPVNNDVGGLAPVDMVFKGITAKINLSLNRYNEDKLMEFVGNLGAIPSADRVAKAAFQPGIMDAAQIGALSEIGHLGGTKAHHTKGYWLALKFSFSGNASLVGLPPGYWFPSVHVAQFAYEQVGSKHKKIALSLEAHPQVVSVANGAADDRGMAAGAYFNRLYTTEQAIFSFSTLPNAD